MKPTLIAAALLALLLLLVVIPALTDHSDHHEFGSASRVTKTAPPFVSAPSPSEHALVALNFELVRASRPEVRHKATRRAVVAAGGLNGHACGGTLPPCWVLARESGGDITARNPRSTASGKWQVLDSTWKGFGGFARAYLAPESVQDAFARILWDGGRGCRHWSAC